MADSDDGRVTDVKFLSKPMANLGTAIMIMVANKGGDIKDAGRAADEVTDAAFDKISEWFTFKEEDEEELERLITKEIEGNMESLVGQFDEQEGD